MNEVNPGTRTARGPVIAAFLAAGALVLALGLFGSRGGPDPDAVVPPLRITAPASGDTVAGAVTLEFTTPADLQLHGAMGWMAGELHLHAMVGTTELMPAAADITRDADGYRWQLPALPQGSHRLYLTWAGRHHGNLVGVTDTITLHVQP